MPEGILPNNNPALNVISNDITNYWAGSRRQEIVFPIHYRRLLELRDASPTNRVLFRVRNLGDPDTVDGVWTSLTNQNPNRRANFVLPNNIIGNLTRIIPPNGDNLFICARLYLDAQGVRGVYFHMVQGPYHTGGTGGDNVCGGIKIPTTP